MILLNWYLFQYILKRVGHSLSYSHDFRNHRNSDLSIGSESIVKHGLSQNRPLFDRKSKGEHDNAWDQSYITLQTFLPHSQTMQTLCWSCLRHKMLAKPSKKTSSVTPKFRAKQFPRDFCAWGNMLSWNSVICGLKLMKYTAYKGSKKEKNCKKWKWKKWNLVIKKYGFQGLTIICRCHLKTAAA